MQTASVADAALAEQLAYYRARAPVYDEEAYRSKSDDWWAEMSLVVEHLDRAQLDGDVVELACGSGFWTERLVAGGARVTAFDGAPEMLDVVRARLGDSAAVELVVADLFEWRPARTWDACVTCFWLCHVPDDRLPAMLAAMAAAVRPGGRLFVADKSSPSPSTEREAAGRTYTVVDIHRSPEAFIAAFDAAGFDADVTVTGRRFCVVSAQRR